MLLSIEPTSGVPLEPDGSERRRGLRLRQQRPIKVFDTTTGRYFGGETEDVSVTGLRIMLPKSSPVRPGSMLAVHVGLDGAGHPLANRRDMMPARVVWVDREGDPQGRALAAGIEWTASITALLDAA
jgi:PilZ domain